VIDRRIADQDVDPAVRLAAPEINAFSRREMLMTGLSPPAGGCPRQLLAGVNFAG
jgi:hypothetical protein